MIVHSQHQQVHNYHLTLSVILLILTVYPYLFEQNRWSVAAYSADDLNLKHRSIENFDILELDDITISRVLTTRATTSDASNSDAENQAGNSDNSNNQIEFSDAIHKLEQPLQRVHFYSLGKQFNLVLGKAAHLITDDFSVVTLDSSNKATRVPFNRNDLLILNGYLEGDSKSRVTVSISKKNKLTTAQIKTDQDGTIILEPTYLHRNKFLSSSPDASNASSDFMNSDSSKNKMIVYNLRDFKQDQSLNDTYSNYDLNLTKLCAALDVNDTDSAFLSNSSSILLDKDEKQQQDLEDVFKFYSRSNGEGNKRGRDFRAKRGIKFPTETSEKTRCTLHLVADYLFYKNVGNSDFQTTVNYLLALIHRVNQIYLPTVWETGDDSGGFSNIGFTVQNITIHQEYTQRSSNGDIHYNMQSDRIWEAREFLDNFSRNSPPKHYCLAHLLTYRQFDKPILGLAYVASHIFGRPGGICSPTQQMGDVYYKHNTGISTSRGITGETLITRQADLVIAHELGHNLGADHDSNECRPESSNGGGFLMHPYSVLGFERNNKFLSNCSRIAIGKVISRKASTCFVGAVENICGNGVVEEGEECDGGDVGYQHTDPCCDSMCRLTSGSQCSDRHSFCCSKCRIMTAGFSCRPAEPFNCKQESFCNGSSAECPEPSEAEDDKICVGRGLCRRGECIPFCEARGLISCLCNTPANACRLCCKTSINSTCNPFDVNMEILPDGVMCYRGVCEKGRCEQPIQDVVQRLWDVIEDINYTSLVKFLRDNIILVVLISSIPVWCIFSHYINEFDKRIRRDVINAMLRRTERRKSQPGQSPFLPRLFVGDDPNPYPDIDEGNQNAGQDDEQFSHSRGELEHESQQNRAGKFRSRNGDQPIGFRPPFYGIRLPAGEGVVMEPSGSVEMNSIELPNEQNTEVLPEENNQPEDVNKFDPSSLFSTRV